MLPATFLGGIRWMPCKNTGSEDCPSFGAIKITDQALEEGKLVFRGTKFDTTFSPHFMLAGEGGIKAGKWGLVTHDVAVALCMSGSVPANGEEWGIQPSAWTLRKHFNGAVVLGGMQGTGTGQRAVVRTYRPTVLFGVLTGSLAYNGNAGFEIQYNNVGTWTDQGWADVTVYDAFLRATDTALASATFCRAEWYSNRWWVTQARCA